MNTLLQFAVLGLGAGAVYALLSLGIVAVYRGSGVLNFGHGALAMAAAFLFWDLETQRGWSRELAFVTTVLVVTLLGVLIHHALMRPLKNSAPLAKAIATLGVLLVLEAFATLVWGSTPKFVAPILPTDPVELAGLTVGVDRLIMVGVAVAMCVLLSAGYRWTRIGLATTAVAENPRAGAALGWSPDVLATINWALGAALAAVGGILISPLTGLQVQTLSLLVIAALAAALIGGFRSFPLTLVAAITLGVSQAVVARYVDVQGAAESLPFLIVVLFLVASGKALPSRGHLSERFADIGTGRISWPTLGALGAVLVVLVLFVFPVRLVDAVTVTFLVGLVLLSVVVLTGYAGQLSLASFALGGVGALIAGHLVAERGWGFGPALAVGALGTVPIGLLFGIPALRTRGVNLAVVTLGLGVAAQAVIFNNAKYTGGIDGTRVGPQKLLGIDVDPVTHPENYAVLAIGAFILCALAVSSLRRGRAGRRLIAVRTNERAAASLGISVFGSKLYAFALSALIAGLAGAMLGFRTHTIIFTQFDPIQSILAVAYAVIGGVGYIIGPVFGATLAEGAFGGWVAEEAVPGLDSYMHLIGGILLLVFLIADANGMASTNVALVKKLLRWRAPEAPPLPAVEVSRVQPKTLTVRDLVVRFGGVTAVDGVSLDVRPGRITGLIGPNGAGKTTVIDAVSGFVRAQQGRVFLDDKRIDRLSAAARARRGMSRSFQALELFEDVSVQENLRAASDSRDKLAYLTNLLRPGNAPLPAAAVAAVREFGLEEELLERPTELAFGKRRLVAVARAVASEPSVLLLDEPAAGLDADETAELAELVRRLADEWGIGILLVEHDMSFVMGVCDEVAVLDFGRQIAYGTPGEVRSDPAVIRAYLGAESHDDAKSDLPTAPDLMVSTGVEAPVQEVPR